jgi:hypothetical protein
MTGNRPLDGGPLRVGFRWRQTVVHERQTCRSDWVIAGLERGRRLEQRRLHFCAVSGREVRGRERWDFEPGADGTTTVTLRTWHDGGWRERAFGSQLHDFQVRRRLAYLQFAVENR